MVPCRATFIDNEGGEHPNIVPFKIGNVWVFQAYQGKWFKLTSTDINGNKIENRHSDTELTSSNAASQWETANRGGYYNVIDVMFCQPSGNK
jgi:hypothetical protein